MRFHCSVSSVGFFFWPSWKVLSMSSSLPVERKCKLVACRRTRDFRVDAKLDPQLQLFNGSMLLCLRRLLLLLLLLLTFILPVYIIFVLLTKVACMYWSSCFWWFLLHSLACKLFFFFRSPILMASRYLCWHYVCSFLMYYPLIA